MSAPVEPVDPLVASAFMLAWRKARLHPDRLMEAWKAWGKYWLRCPGGDEVVVMAVHPETGIALKPDEWMQALRREYPGLRAIWWWRGRRASYWWRSLKAWWRDPVHEREHEWAPRLAILWIGLAWHRLTIAALVAVLVAVGAAVALRLL